MSSRSSNTSSVYTTRPETAQERLQRRFHQLSHLYTHDGKNPIFTRPKNKTELDVLKEHHQFIRNADVKALTWEDQLAEKYYNSLFREFALVDLKHYKSGAIALRWRTEPELLDGIGHLTCASLRCSNHQSSITTPQLERQDSAEEEERPLVPVPLFEQEMQFGYLEEGLKKSALVKVVLCEDCSRKLKKGREKAKELRREKERQIRGPVEPAQARKVQEESEEEEAEELGPELPPELEQSRRSNRAESERRRRRSASPLTRSSRSDR